MIKKVIIPAAGKGTRLLPATKETPKEMLPILWGGNKNKLVVKPLLQVIFEQYYSMGSREFYFVVGRGKGSIIDHFSLDYEIINTLNAAGGRDDLTEEILRFYNSINKSSLGYISQPEPKGFGDAILRAEPFVEETFLVQAGDTLILSKNKRYINNLTKISNQYESEATILIKKVENPKSYGIVEGKELRAGVYDVHNVVEKPLKPQSKFAITAVYLFKPSIFEALQKTNIGIGGELQLTDGIQQLINLGYKVTALELKKDEYWLDIGNAKSYWDALSQVYQYNN